MNRINDVDKLADIIRDELLGMYYCKRVWSAWNVGTMTQDDFLSAEEAGFAENIAHAIISSQPVQPALDAQTLKPVEALMWLADFFASRLYLEGQNEAKQNTTAARDSLQAALNNLIADRDSLKAKLAQPAQPTTPQPDADNGTYLCRAWGESELPFAAIVTGLSAVQSFLVDQWLGSADKTDDYGTKILPAVMADIQALQNHDSNWITLFEIGGVSVEKVCAAPTLT